MSEADKWGSGKKTCKEWGRGRKGVRKVTVKGRQQIQTHSGWGYCPVLSCITFRLILLGSVCVILL